MERVSAGIVLARERTPHRADGRAGNRPFTEAGEPTTAGGRVGQRPCRGSVPLPGFEGEKQLSLNTPAPGRGIPRGSRGQMGFDMPPPPTPDLVEVRPTAVRRYPEYVPLPVRQGPGGPHRGIPQDPSLPGGLVEGKHPAVAAEVPASPRPSRRDGGPLPGRTTQGLVLEGRLPISVRGGFLRPGALG